MRILDLGICDAGVMLWIADKLDAPLHVDGIDLDRNMTRDATRRLREAGIPGEVKRGNALDAPALFEPGSYDVIVGFELLEHIPQPTDLLDVAERMVKPGGRIFLSTPDGCFGLGGNPHHLHAFRSIDVVEMVRRRGRLLDAQVGCDGVTVAAYEPRTRREDVAIYTGPGWMPWSPHDIDTKGLGGSETAAVRLAEALSELGYVVTVFGDTEQGCFGEVVYRHHSTFDPLERRDVLISSRMPEIFDRRPNCRQRFLWVHDVDVGARLTQKRAEHIDHILALSEWHHGHLHDVYPHARGKLRQIRNGIRPELFTPKPWAERARRVLYTSSPDRGLDILLELWPRIRAQVPDAVLGFCYPDVYERVAQLDDTVREHRKRILTLADQPGVERLGALSQPALADLLCDTRVWAHPSWMGQHDAAFQETSCIAAMEAQAAGCVAVASNWGALSETVRHGYKIDGPGDSDQWRDAFVSCIVDGLTRQDVGDLAVIEGPKAVADLGWDGVAADVHRMIVGES